MIGLKLIGWRPGPVYKALRQSSKAPRVIASQTLNRQARQYRTRATRLIAAETGISPMKRIRRRIILPRTGQANARRLIAITLTLLELTPLRWYGRRGPKVGRVVETGGARVVDLSAIAYRVRERVLRELGAEWAPEVERRLAVSLKRIWGKVIWRSLGGRRTGRSLARGAARSIVNA